MTHTRVDIVVFICALQRVTRKPQIQHVRRLNKLLAWIQRHPKKLLYKRFGKAPGGSHRAETRKPTPHLRVISDAAYKKETEDGYSLRGALFLRGEGNDRDSFSKNTTVHVLDWACRSQRHVTRSTFSAELLSAGDAIDQGMLISHMLYDMEHGPISMQEARKNAGWVCANSFVPRR